MPEEINFSADIKRLLDLVISNLYSDKNLAVRELVSNAADACHALELLARQGKASYSAEPLAIKVHATKTQLIISDNGVGMTAEELTTNLGTIAYSTTRQLSATGDGELIGQFGVGFYSAFMIARNVKVVSKAASSDINIWESDGISGSFFVRQYDREIQIENSGTVVILELRDDAIANFTNFFHLKSIIQAYSSHITVPIYLSTDGENSHKEIKVNNGQAIWQIPKHEISQEEYEEFFQSFTHLPSSPLFVIHNQIEGAVSFASLIFIPDSPPFDLYDPDRKTRIKLYAKRVMISDDASLIPAWLRFCRGLVDSLDLPLNVSRESLQESTLLTKIRNILTDKILQFLLKASDDQAKYQKFWNSFGAVLKEGLCESNVDREALLSLCLFRSTASHDELISLDRYIERNEKIYYAIGNSSTELSSSAIVQDFATQKKEVLLLTDAVDDFWVTVVESYKNHQFVSVNKVTREELNQETPKAFCQMILRFKEVLGATVSDIMIAPHITSSAAFLAVKDGGMEIRLEKFLREQKQFAGQSAKILQLNPNHQLVIEMAKLCNDWDQLDDSDKDATKQAAWMIFWSSAIASGEEIVDRAGCANAMIDFTGAALFD